jgi:trimeric autotransporter adhesin
MQIRSACRPALLRGGVLPFVLAAALGCSDGTDPSDDGPTILLMNPSGVPTGQGPFVLSVYGEGFVSGAFVKWNGEPRETYIYSANVLNAAISADDVAAAGSARVTVTLPDSSTSAPATFRIGQLIEPAISLDALSPDHATAGGDTTEVTVTGSGFVRGTVLFLDWAEMPTSFVSSTTVRATVPAELLTVQRAMEARIGIPGFWTAPIPTPWEVRAAAPQVTTLSPAGAGAGSADLDIRVSGTGFIASSVVLVNGAERPTTFVSRTELRTTLPEADLAGARTIGISVRTPAPGGGTSAPFDFAVTSEPPLLSALPLLGITAGRPGITLVVHGQHFSPGSVVEWNGSERVTTYRNGRRLFAIITAADIAAPGTATITVRTLGFPSTQPRSLTIHPVPSATLTSVETLALPAQWLATDPVSGRLFATIAGSASQHGNTVAEIDPEGPAVAGSVFVGSEPTVAEVSDDGRYLYVGLDGAQSVRRVDLPDLTPGAQFSLGTLTVEELHVMPGMAGTVAVSRRNAGYSPSNEGLFIYDDGVPRGLGGPGHTGSNSFGWTADGTSMFGFNFESTEFGLRRLSVGPDGAREVWVRGGLIDGFYARIQVVGDRIYGGDGSVVDGDLRERLGRCSMSGWFAVDRGLGRAFFWVDNKIRVCDLGTYQSMGEIDVPVPNLPNPAERHNIVRWGTDGLAFSDGAAIYIVRTPLAAP